MKSKVAGVSTSDNGDETVGLVISHHNLSKEFIIRTLDKIKNSNNYSTIVIFGPNHFYPDETAFLTSTKASGFQISQDDVQNLLNNKKVIQDEGRVEKEHSINTPADYLEKYYPNAKFIPLVVPQYFDAKELADLALFLTTNLPEDTLYVASVDFSHEKTVLEAENKNIESEEAIKNFDFDKIYSFGSDHMDSPASIGLLLNVMKDKGTTKWDLLFDTHGAFIENNPVLQGTSYVFGVFK